jgi:hypothetical protein
MSFVRILLLMSLLILPGTRASAQQFSREKFLDSAMTQDEYIRLNLAKFITPEYVERHDRMRLIQRTGYASVKSEFLRHDAFSAIVDYIRMRLHSEYSQNTSAVTYPSQTHVLFGLPIDYSYPDDPWKRESWER